MALFALAHVPLDEAERILGRPLEGTPSEGEIAIVQALNADQFRSVRDALAADGLEPHFRALIEERLRQGTSRGAQHVTLRVRVPNALREHYERIAARLGLSLSETIENAILRDYRSHQDASAATEQLADSVNAYHRAAAKLTQDLRSTLERAGAVAEINMRLGRIEGAIQLIVSAIPRR